MQRFKNIFFKDISNSQTKEMHKASSFLAQVALTPKTIQNIDERRSKVTTQKKKRVKDEKIQKNLPISHH